MAEYNIWLKNYIFNVFIQKSMLFCCSYKEYCYEKYYFCCFYFSRISDGLFISFISAYLIFIKINNYND